MPGTWNAERREAMRQRAVIRNRVHGLSGHRFYPIWRDMMNRCYSPKNRFYGDYGGRGICVSPDWQKVENFIVWCETQTFEEGMSLDRYPDVNGPYSAANCRFATPSQQNRNMRSNVWVEHNGERLIFKDFVLKYGVVSPAIAQKRRKKCGWDAKAAAFTPLVPRSERWSYR